MEFVVDKERALEIVAANYRGPVKYAKAVLERWPRSSALVAYVDGAAAGAEIFYQITLSWPVCVHYYVAVAPPYRRRGVATALVRRVEDVCKASVYAATSTEDNKAAEALFTKLGYVPYVWRDIPRRARDVWLKATCGYDDDVLFIKGADPASAASYTREVEEFWKETCLRPYLGLY
ncbi:MAG: GNAT family N-acetyltransferase [Pyrobaculum sp.]